VAGRRLCQINLSPLTEASWKAPDNGTGFGYKVYQQDIDWDLKIGDMTNLERASGGGAPYVMKEGVPRRIELHHSRQDAQGPLFELSSTTHRAASGRGREALHPYGNTKHPDYPVVRRLFDIDRPAYWEWRSNQEILRRAQRGSQ